MSYYSCSHRSESRWCAIKLGVCILVGVLTVAWMIAEFACTRSFVGTLSYKEAEVSYSHDERRYRDGEWKGSDRTTAHINYKLTFYSEGELRSVSAGKFSESVGRVNAEGAAYERLMSNHTEPALYTHTSKELTYIVTVSGWLLDGTLVDAVNIDTIRAEK